MTIQIGGSIDKIRIDYTACRLGGLRPWWRCPGCHSRRGVLYEKDHRWRCRNCVGLTYRSQRVSWLARAAEKGRRLHALLGGTGRLADELPMSRPARMRRKTYRRIHYEYSEAVNLLNKLLRAAMQRQYGRIELSASRSAAPRRGSLCIPHSSQCKNFLSVGGHGPDPGGAVGGERHRVERQAPRAPLQLARARPETRSSRPELPPRWNPLANAASSPYR